ncbi:unnamed protein product, partial [Adineta steineri]
YERVLFEIDADPSKDRVKPFADLSKFSYFPEEEFLMTLGSVFYLKNIYLGENHIWHIEMDLYGNIDYDLHNTFHHLQNQYSLNTQQKKGDIKQALQSYEKVLTIFQQQSNRNEQTLAWCYNNLGAIYEDKKEYDKARDYLNKALNIKLKYLPRKHPCLSNTYNNLGNIHYYFHDYDQALDMYQLSYEILSKSLTPGHPSIARLLMNIGIVYETKQDFNEANINYENASLICTKILSLTHPDRISTQNDLIR